MASCTDPYRRLYFTITFRSFSPIPGSLEFHPGQDYYFITTSHPNDLHSKSGGRCASHNMKVIFKVANSTLKNLVSENPDVENPDIENTGVKSVNSERPQLVFDDKNKYYPVLQNSEKTDDRSIKATAKKVLQDFQKKYHQQNEVILKQEASRMHSGGQKLQASAVKLILSPRGNTATFLMYLLCFMLPLVQRW